MSRVIRSGVKIPEHIQAAFAPGAVKAGVLAGATYPEDTYTDKRTGAQVRDARGGMPVAAIAQALEYGHGQNHPRPFLQTTVASRGREWARNLTALLRDGAGGDQALRILGVRMAEDIQQTVRDWPADNSADWAAVKGFDHGLVQTGHLTNSIDSAVVEED